MRSYSITELFHTSWSELYADQAAMALFFRRRIEDLQKKGRPGLVKAGHYRILLAKQLCKKRGIIKKLSPEQLYDITEDLTFLNDPLYFFHVTTLKTKAGRLISPDEKVSSFTFFQLVKADAEYSKFLVQISKLDPGQYHTLDRFISILYQPERHKFNELDIEKYAGILPKGLTYDLKYLILHVYSHCRRYIVEDRCPNLFPKQENRSQEPQYTGEMWQDLLFDLSETPAFSGLETAQNAPIYKALDYLEKKAKENTKIKSNGSY